MTIIYIILQHYLTYLILGVVLVLIFYKLTEIYYNMDTRTWRFTALYIIRWTCIVLGLLCICSALTLYKRTLDVPNKVPIPIHKPESPEDVIHV